MEAIVWRHGSGAKGRSVPAELGPWWMAAQCWNRWFHAGAWQRLLALAQEHGGGAKLGIAFLDGSTIRARGCATGAAKRGIGAELDQRKALGRSRGGFGIKAEP